MDSIKRTQAEKYTEEHQSSAYSSKLGPHGEEYESYAFVAYLEHKADQKDALLEAMVSWQKKLSNCYQAMLPCNYPPSIVSCIKDLAEELAVRIGG